MNEKEILEATINMRNGEQIMQRDGEYWTEEEREILQHEYKSGTAINVIALMLQRSEGAIYQQVERMGLYTRNPFSIRKKSMKSNNTCLCKNCKCDCSICPRYKVYQTVMEDV